MKQTSIQTLLLCMCALVGVSTHLCAQVTSYPDLRGRIVLRDITLDGCPIDSLIVRYLLVVKDEVPYVTSQLTWYGASTAPATCVSANLTAYVSVDKGGLRRWVSLPIAVATSGQLGKEVTERRMWKELFLPVSEVARGRDVLDNRRRKGLEPEVAQALWASQPSIERIVLTRPGGFGEDGLRKPDFIYEVSMPVLNERFSPDVVSSKELKSVGLKTSYTTAKDTATRIAQLYRGSVSVGGIFHNDGNVYDVKTDFNPYYIPGFAFLPMVAESGFGFQIGGDYVYWFNKERINIIKPIGVFGSAQYYSAKKIVATQRFPIVPSFTGLSSSFDFSEISLRAGIMHRFFNVFVITQKYFAEGSIFFPPLDRKFTSTFGDFRVYWGLGVTPLNRRKLRASFDLLFLENIAFRFRIDYKYFYTQTNLDLGVSSFSVGARYAW